MRRRANWGFGALLIWLVAVLCVAGGVIWFGVLSVQNAQAAEPVNGVEVPAVKRLTLTREAQRVWGPQAPVARFAAQIHAESTWRSGVCSHAGACGLGQFMPKTAEWLAALYPEQLEPVAVEDWRWSVRALSIYTWRLHQAEQGWRTESDRWAATLVSYVGGGGWLRRERRAADAAGDDPDRYWQHVERRCIRAAWACRDSRAYPRRILCELEPRYVAAGWPGEPLACR